MRKFLFATISLLISFTMFGISTKNEEQYNYRIKNEILPYFNLHNAEKYKKNLKKFKGHSFKRGTINIAYDIFGPEDAKYHIVVLHGLGETYAKYAELMYDLQVLTDNNIRFYVMDHRGFGFSDRFNMRNPKAANMDNFDYAVEDVKNFMDSIVKPDILKTTGDRSPVYLFAHSMGGGIATRFLQLNHDYFEKVILNAPMQSIKLPGVGVPIVDDNVIFTIAAINVIAGKSEYYFNLAGYMQEEPNRGYKKYEDNSKCTNSSERYYFGAKTIYGSKAEPGLYLENAVGGHTFGWLYNSAALCMNIKKFVYSIDPKADIKIFQAEDDQLVNNQRHNLIGFLLDNCEVIRFKSIKEDVKSRHELFMEIDEIRGDGESIPNTLEPVTVIDHIVTFFNLEIGSHINSTYI